MRLELPKFTELFSGSFENYKKTWKLFLKVYARSFLYTLIPIALGLILGFISFSVVPRDYFALPVIMIVIACYVAITYIGAWSGLAMAKVAMLSAAAEPVNESSGKVYSEVRPMVWTMMVVTILSGLIVTSGFLLLIIPGIILAISFSFTTFTVLVDKKKGLEALLLSRDYIKGNVANIFFYMFLFALIQYGLLGFVPSYILEQLEIPLISDILGLIVSTIMMPVSLIFSYKLYEFIKSSKGEVVFAADSGRKAKYYSLIIIVVLTILGVVVFGFNLLKGFTDRVPSYDKYKLPTASETLS